MQPEVPLVITYLLIKCVVWNAHIQWQVENCQNKNVVSSINSVKLAFKPLLIWVWVC